MANKKALANGTSVKASLPELSEEAGKNGHKEMNQKARSPKPRSKVVKKQLLGNSHFEMSEILEILSEVKNGNFNVRMPVDQVGMTGKIYDSLNEIISMNQR